MNERSRRSDPLAIVPLMKKNTLAKMAQSRSASHRCCSVGTDKELCVYFALDLSSKKQAEAGKLPINESLEQRRENARKVALGRSQPEL